jgi:glutathione S-transferase
MKLYFVKSTCSRAPHILIRELGIDVELERLYMKNKDQLNEKNPKGLVPILELDNGERLTEVSVLLQYLAATNNSTLLPEYGSMPYYRTLEWLNYIATELHKMFIPFFRYASICEDATKEIYLKEYKNKLKWLDLHFQTQNWLLGDSYSIADIYLFVVLSWSPFIGIDFNEYPALLAFNERMLKRPAVSAAIEFEEQRS